MHNVHLNPVHTGGIIDVGGEMVPIYYRKNVLAELKARGYSTYRLRREKILSESALTQIRRGEPVSWAVLEKLCEMLECAPGDILDYQRGGETGV